MLTRCSTIFWILFSMSKSVEVLAVCSGVVWADMRAICEVAVGLPPALVPGWADMRATNCEEMARGLPLFLVLSWPDMVATC